MANSVLTSFARSLPVLFPVRLPPGPTKQQLSPVATKDEENRFVAKQRRRQDWRISGQFSLSPCSFFGPPTPSSSAFSSSFPAFPRIPTLLRRLPETHLHGARRLKQQGSRRLSCPKDSVCVHSFFFCRGQLSDEESEPGFLLSCALSRSSTLALLFSPTSHALFAALLSALLCSALPLSSIAQSFLHLKFSYFFKNFFRTFFRPLSFAAFRSPPSLR